MTLGDLINQSFGKGGRRDWHLEKLTPLPFPKTFAEHEVTNTLRASLHNTVMRQAGCKVKRKIADVNRALYLCDHLYGNGLETLLIKNTQEAVTRKLAVFYRVNLNTVADRILAFYT